MLINSIKFVVFAALVVFLYYIVPLKKRWIVLLVSSYIFYFLSSKYLIVFILLSTLSIYLSGILIGKQDDLLASCEDKEKKKELKIKVKKRKKLILTLGILFNVGILLVLKYSNFFITTVNSIVKSNIPLVKFLLPLGISYYTLQAISYIADVYRGKYKPSKNIFEVSVTKWIKKEIPKGHRTYIFSCKSVEELYRWLISLNFVKVNAYYDFFVSNFGLVKFPLNPTDKIKKKKYDLRLENIEGFQKVFKSTSPSKRRLSFGQEIVLENKEIVDAFKTVVSYGFSVILGNIQGNITKKKNEEEEDAGLIKKREIH